ncbi:uncharacterized protein LOC131678775 [Topomyia yanbarensis]|uniref:uncharacterized protein LOC131678775 n=1 Tax=Topomyia yanbarensis TaxID=2498891 RepID=UPI00273C1837|nr:uncharacterized protein LOC131678775 [Topomyia yanbarensis]XP_058815049.1 uncharacterized protein LOC131678775 [Topomyia yanbarensis]XP_058815050.1 uncharacterized protein LOC131678775 [Topomyia yanbarensis]XP_058815051.1 uncharacterized protein LOC131678775 [Topomyia yanbarensis]
MAATPDRLNNSKNRIQSPRTPTSPSDTTVGASRVKDAVEKCIDLYQKWRITTQKGAQYCNAIESIEKGVLEPKAKNCNPYPANLELYCKNLAILNGILEEVVNDLDMIVQQQQVLELVMKGELVGRSWSMEYVLDALRRILQSFRSELVLRKVVTENIGHGCSVQELALHVAFWEQLSNQNENMNLLVKMLHSELNIPLTS